MCSMGTLSTLAGRIFYDIWIGVVYVYISRHLLVERFLGKERCFEAFEECFMYGFK